MRAPSRRAEGDDITGPGTVDLDVLVALEVVHAAYAVAVDRLAVLDLATPDPGQRQLAAMLGVEGLENLGGDGSVAAAPFGGAFRIGSPVAEFLEQAADTVLEFRGAKQDGHHPRFSEGPAEFADHVFLGRHLVLENLHHQVVAEIGESLQHHVARLVLSFHDAVWHLDGFGGAALMIVPGRLADQVDIAGDVVIVANGHLRDQQGCPGNVLHGWQEFAHQGGCAVHLVDEHEMGNPVVFKETEDWRQGRCPFHHRLIDHHRGIGADQRVARFGLELDGAGAVEKVEVDPLEGGMAGTDLRAHVALARLRRRIAHGVPFLHGTLATDGAADVEHGLEERVVFPLSDGPTMAMFLMSGMIVSQAARLAPCEPSVTRRTLQCPAA